MSRKILMIAAITLAALSISSNLAQAKEYKWCAYYGLFGSAATNCGFDTLAQCRATISGIGGTCQVNPAYAGRTGRSRQSQRY
jgi:hypothetical protein